MNEEPHGFFATLSDLQQRFGAAKVSALSDPWESGVERSDNIQMAIDFADANIIGAFIGLDEFTTPIKPLGDDVRRARDWATALAGYWLYSLVGSRDWASDHEKFVQLRSEAAADIKSVKLGGTFNAARRADYEK